MTHSQEATTTSRKAQEYAAWQQTAFGRAWRLIERANHRTMETGGMALLDMGLWRPLIAWELVLGPWADVFDWTPKRGGAPLGPSLSRISERTTPKIYAGNFVVEPFRHNHWRKHSTVEQIVENGWSHANRMATEPLELRLITQDEIEEIKNACALRRLRDGRAAS